MVHDTFGTTNLETLSAMLWESGWDYVKGTIYEKEYKGTMLRGSLEMQDNYYALKAI